MSIDKKVFYIYILHIDDHLDCIHLVYKDAASKEHLLWHAHGLYRQHTDACWFMYPISSLETVYFIEHLWEKLSLGIHSFKVKCFTKTK